MRLMTRSGIKGIISDLIRRWGVKFLLREIIDVLKKMDDDVLQNLAKDLEVVFNKYKDKLS